MHEHITHAIYFSEVHFIYSSVVWLAAWILTSVPGGSATAKHWIWVATALNFILPMGVVIDGLLAPHISWATPLAAVGGLGVAISDNAPFADTLGAVWLIGASVMLARLGARIATEQRSHRAAICQSGFVPSPDLNAKGVAVRFGDTRRGPAVNGLIRTHISLPHGIDRLLDERELNSVLMHELTHAKRYDNLIRLLYEVALCALWFHPLVWITGSRLALYRELSCDESAIRRGHGRELASALAKLAHFDESLLLQATATSLLSRRLAQLTMGHALPARTAASASLSTCFALIFAAGMFATVTHTACCFVATR